MLNDKIKIKITLKLFVSVAALKFMRHFYSIYSYSRKILILAIGYSGKNHFEDFFFWENTFKENSFREFAFGENTF